MIIQAHQPIFVAQANKTEGQEGRTQEYERSQLGEQSKLRGYQTCQLVFAQIQKRCTKKRVMDKQANNERHPNTANLFLLSNAEPQA
jgi:hypothetical protein